MTKTRRIVLVSGGNRGLGLETCRQLAGRGYRVVLGSRDPGRGDAAAASLRDAGGDVVTVPLDVTDEESVARAADWVERQVGPVDVLVNNAGVIPDTASPGSSFLEGTVEVLRVGMERNLFGAFRLCRRLVPGMRERRWGRVVNVSTGMAQLSDMNGGYPGYRLSKTALNALTRIVADEVQGAGVLVNSVCPGWVRTEMGGPGATRSVEEGAAGIVWAATLPDDGPSGGFFRDGNAIPW